jgi:hypothetical protein
VHFVGLLFQIVKQVGTELAEFDVGIGYMQRMGIPSQIGLIFLKTPENKKNTYTFGMYCWCSVEMCRYESLCWTSCQK